MSTRNAGLTADPLFVGITRPAMRWGVPYVAIIANAMLTMEVFLLSKNLLTLALALPVHGVAMLACARDARFFDLVVLWLRLRVPAASRSLGYWRASSYGPLELDCPNVRGGRRTIPKVRA